MYLLTWMKWLYQQEKMSLMSEDTRFLSIPSSSPMSAEEKATIYWVECNNRSLKAIISIPGIGDPSQLAHNVIFVDFKAKKRYI